MLKGQSISHIFTHHKNEINCCERTLYYYFDKNAFTARIGRTFNDFIKFIEENPNVPVVEIDIVHGTRSGKVLLTFLFRSCSLMLAFLIESCSKKAVKEVIDDLYESLGDEVFKKCFLVILTDNGSEFKEPKSLELNSESNRRTNIFYCNPMASYQKPHVEKNHEYIRYILPKGRSFNHLNQKDITLMINHINSAARGSLNGNTPFKLPQLLLDNSLLEKLSLKHIPADEVHLKPALLQK